MNARDIRNKLKEAQKLREQAEQGSVWDVVRQMDTVRAHFNNVLNVLQKNPDYEYFEFDDFVGYRTPDGRWMHSKGRPVSEVDIWIYETLRFANKCE